jgi:hypothetical protein
MVFETVDIVEAAIEKGVLVNQRQENSYSPFYHRGVGHNDGVHSGLV